MSSSEARIFVAVDGDIYHEAPAMVKYGYFVEALGNIFQLVVCDTTLRGLPRLVNAIQVFSPNRKLWKERFYQNIPAFKLRSRKVAAALRREAGKIDAILQVGVLCDARWQEPDIPGIIYTDYTSRLSSSKPTLGRSPFKSNEWYSLEKQAFIRADHICTRGHFVRRSIIDDYGFHPGQVTAIGGGVNFAALPEFKPRANPLSPTALFIGKEFYRKGGDLVLNAFIQIRQSIPSARLIMVTEGIPAEGFDMSNVLVVPPTWDRTKIQSLYEQADCFVLPSRLETWGDVLLEAMAYGLPCIGVSGEAMGEIIENGKNGLVIPPEDIPALTNALLRLLSNSGLREQFGKAARQRVASTYTWEKVAERLIPIIESTIPRFKEGKS